MRRPVLRELKEHRAHQRVTLRIGVDGLNRQQTLQGRVDGHGTKVVSTTVKFD
jgi:hypothetical protein